MAEPGSKSNHLGDDSVPPPGTPSHERHPKTNLDRRDDRWRVRFFLRDWMILLGMIAVYLLWTGVLYLFEPGIR